MYLVQSGVGYDVHTHSEWDTLDEARTALEKKITKWKEEGHWKDYTPCPYWIFETKTGPTIYAVRATFNTHIATDVATFDTYNDAKEFYLRYYHYTYPQHAYPIGPLAKCVSAGIVTTTIKNKNHNPKLIPWEEWDKQLMFAGYEKPR